MDAPAAARAASRSRPWWAQKIRSLPLGSTARTKPCALQAPRPVLPFGLTTTADASQRSASVKGATVGVARSTSLFSVAMDTRILRLAVDRFRSPAASDAGSPWSRTHGPAALPAQPDERADDVVGDTHPQAHTAGRPNGHESARYRRQRAARYRRQRAARYRRQRAARYQPSARSAIPRSARSAAHRPPRPRQGGRLGLGGVHPPAVVPDLLFVAAEHGPPPELDHPLCKAGRPGTPSVSWSALPLPTVGNGRAGR